MFKRIDNKNVKSVKKFSKVFFILWSVLSAVVFACGVVCLLFFIKNKITLFLILMIICFLSAILFISTALMQGITLYAVASFVSEPQVERENEKEFKKQAGELVKIKEMHSLSLLNDEEYEKQKHAVMEQLYVYFDKLNRKEIIAKFLYLSKSGAVSEDEIEKEKQNYFNETQYKKALILMRGGDYKEAKEIFDELGDYKASKKMSKNSVEKIK